VLCCGVLCCIFWRLADPEVIAGVVARSVAEQCDSQLVQLLADIRVGVGGPLGAGLHAQCAQEVGSRARWITGLAEDRV
jgi:hypothetical protein